MRTLAALILFAAPQLAAQPADAVEHASSPRPRLTADTPMTTALGNPFIAPAEWSVSVRGPATILEAPEGDSWIVLVDVRAKDGDLALAAGWAAYREVKWPLKVTNDAPDRDGERTS